MVEAIARRTRRLLFRPTHQLQADSLYWCGRVLYRTNSPVSVQQVNGYTYNLPDGRQVLVMPSALDCRPV